MCSLFIVLRRISILMVLSRGDNPAHPSCIHFMTTLMFFASRFFRVMTFSCSLKFFHQGMKGGSKFSSSDYSSNSQYLCGSSNLLQIQLNGLFWPSWIWHANLQTDKMLKYKKTNSYVRLHVLINAATLYVKYKYTHVNIQSSIHIAIEIIIIMIQYNNICLLVFIQLFLIILINQCISYFTHCCDNIHEEAQRTGLFVFVLTAQMCSPSLKGNFRQVLEVALCRASNLSSPFCSI